MKGDVAACFSYTWARVSSYDMLQMKRLQEINLLPRVFPVYEIVS